MKGKRFVFFLLGLAIGVASIWAMVQSQQPEKSEKQVQQETYVSKVVIQAPWGVKNLVYDKEESKPGEFAFYQYQVPESLKMVVDAGLPEGPSAFTVAPNGDIYITDPLNYRVQRFSPEGQCISVISGIQRKVWDWKDICVDENNNIYLLWDEQRPIVHVGKYDQSGKLLLTYSVTGVQRLGGAAPHIFCDNKGGLFIEFTYGIKGVPPYPSIFQIGTSEREFTEEEQKNTIRRGSIQTGGLSPDTLYLDEFTLGGGLIAQYDSKGNKIKEFPTSVTGSFIARDETGRIYTRSTSQDKIDRSLFSTILKKYDQNGNLLLTLEWKRKIGSCPSSTVENSTIVDKKGNIFKYCATQDGLTITKWYKQ